MNMIKGLKIINNQFDRELVKEIRHTERVNNVKVQCRTGCNHCCNLVVSTSLPEAMHMVVAIGEARMLAMIPAWIVDAKFLARATEQEVQNYWRPCSMLSTEGLCSIYDQRPFSCRSHVSFSDPEQCSEPHLEHARLAGAHMLCAHYTLQLGNIGLPNAMAPMSYSLLAAALVEREGEGIIEKLRNTSAFDLTKSVRAWQHLMEDDSVKAQPFPIYPIWEHFE